MKCPLSRSTPHTRPPLEKVVTTSRTAVKAKLERKDAVERAGLFSTGGPAGPACCHQTVAPLVAGGGWSVVPGLVCDVRRCPPVSAAGLLPRPQPPVCAWSSPGPRPGQGEAAVPDM